MLCEQHALLWPDAWRGCGKYGAHGCLRPCKQHSNVVTCMHVKVKGPTGCMDGCTTITR